VTEHLLGKCKALSPNPGTAKKKILSSKEEESTSGLQNQTRIHEGEVI
jgi:hypothetical protein